MPRRSKVAHVEGFAELNDALHLVGDHASGILLKRAVEYASIPIVEEAQRLAPKRTGALARGIHARLTRSQVGRAVWDITYSGKQWYGRLVELGHKTRGTSHVPAHPFLRPALESKSDEAEQRFSQKLNEMLEGTF